MSEQSNIEDRSREIEPTCGNVTASIYKFNWTNRNTAELLNLWKENYGDLKAAKRNTPIYKRMASELSSTLEIVPALTGPQIQYKINNLRKQFRREKKLVGPSGGAPSKWWAYDIVASIIGGEATLDSDLLSESQDFSTQDFSNSPIVITHEDTETVSILNLGNLDTTGETENIFTADSPAPSTSSDTTECSKRPTSDLANTANKKAKNEADDCSGENYYWRNMNKIVSFLKCKNTINDCESIIQPLSLSNLVPFKFNSEGELLKRSIWSKPKSTQWFDEIFPQMDGRDFKEHFRVNRSTFNFLVKELGPHICKMTTTMRDPISVVKRIAVALHYLASCEEYRVVSSLFGIGKSTANVIVHEFVDVVNEFLLPKFVQFPLSEEKLKECSQDFEAILGFPQCVGAVDGCHIPVSPPKEQAISYYNYKGWYSMVLFAVVDCRYRFIYTSVGSPGRNNDGYILQNSSLKAILDSNLFDKSCKELGGSRVPLCLMGDSAFPLTSHLLKPYPEHLELNEVQKNYNKIFCGARRVVENAFGRLKARFRIVYKRMECDINFATQIINTCVTLHNICEHYVDTITLEWLNRQGDDGRNQPHAVTTAGNNGPGKDIRDSIAKYLYEKDHQ
ncbi:unnamed protein product [Rotaria magnacalcarata]|uniref:Transposase n=1 Tax=Rotaria magnacalcarata TaxID=392030 RepID=A0A819GAN5_9BILA|nr:unnamed protein product [Rotaria magnacalcarata]CAF3881221.1 unnamed protein product [Rotaria magnacalcarata]